MTEDERGRVRFIAYMVSLQFQINTLASVSIEYPRLRKHPLLKGSA